MNSKIEYKVAVFDQGDAGELFQVDDVKKFASKASAIEAAKDLASAHNGVLAWMSEPSGEKHKRTVIYKAGEVIDAA